MGFACVAGREGTLIIRNLSVEKAMWYFVLFRKDTENRWDNVFGSDWTGLAIVSKIIMEMIIYFYIYMYGHES